MTLKRYQPKSNIYTHVGNKSNLQMWVESKGGSERWLEGGGSQDGENEKR